MCTVSIFSKDGELIVTMNRDEQRTRSEEGNLHVDNNHCYPIDIQSQGTWIGMNDNGIICTLLNRYQDKHDLNAPKSRGQIIPEFLKCNNIEEVSQKINDFAFEGFNPFDFLVISVSNIIHVTWNRKKFLVKKQNLSTPFFISSSSVKTDDVLQYRREVFDRYIQEKTNNAKDILSQLHLHCEEGQDECAIFMHRDKTHTKSIVQIILQQEQAHMNYWPEGSFKEKITDFEGDFLQEQALSHYFPCGPKNQTNRQNIA